MQGALEILDGCQPAPAFGITITDVCSGGVGLISGGAIPIGSRVNITLLNGLLSGVVIHCEHAGGHFASGISVDHGLGVLARLQWLASLSPQAHPSAAHPQLHTPG